MLRLACTSARKARKHRGGTPIPPARALPAGRGRGGRQSRLSLALGHSTGQISRSDLRTADHPSWRSRSSMGSAASSRRSTALGTGAAQQHDLAYVRRAEFGPQRRVQRPGAPRDRSEIGESVSKRGPPMASRWTGGAAIGSNPHRRRRRRSIRSNRSGSPAEPARDRPSRSTAAAASVSPPPQRARPRSRTGQAATALATRRTASRSAPARRCDREREGRPDPPQRRRGLLAALAMADQQHRIVHRHAEDRHPEAQGDAVNETENRPARRAGRR